MRKGRQLSRCVDCCVGLLACLFVCLLSGFNRFMCIVCMVSKVVYLLNLLLCISGCPYTQPTHPHTNLPTPPPPQKKQVRLAPSDILSAAVAVGLASAELASHHTSFTLNNMVACLVATEILALVGLRSFRTAALLLVGLFVVVGGHDDWLFLCECVCVCGAVAVAVCVVGATCH